VKGLVRSLKRLCALSLLPLYAASAAEGVSPAVLGASDFSTFWAGPHLKIVVTESPGTPQAAFVAAQSRSFSMDRSVPGFGYTNTQYAARLDLLNGTQETVNAHLVVYGPIESFFVQSEGKDGVSPVQSAGMFTKPSRDSKVLFRYPHFPLRLAPGTTSVYLGVEAVAPHFPILVMSDSTFSSFILEQDMLTAGFIAVSGLVLLISLGVALVIRDKITLSFIAWIFFSLPFNLYITGALKPFLYQAIGPGGFDVAVNVEQFVHRNWIVWWGFTQVFSVLFGALFMKIPIGGSSIRSRCIQVGLVSSVLLAAFSRHFPVFAINAFTVPYQIVVVIFCVRSFAQGREGYRPAHCLFAGWSIYSISTALTLSYYFGLLGPSFLTSWGIVIANLAQTISLGTAIFWDRKHRETEALIQIQRNFRELADRDQIIQEYSSSKIVSEISMGVDPRLYKSRWSDLAILFSDMRDFTTLIEKADLSTVEEILNTYIGEIVECTFDFNGEVNKMIGDAVLCIFDDPKTCLNATVALRKRLSDLNRARVGADKRPIKFGSGVSHSRVISMNVGRLGKKLDRTVIGDEVNTAARIEAMTKELYVDVLISEKFQERVAEYPFQRPIGSFLLKGKTAPTMLYEIFGHNSDRVIDYKLSTVPKLKEILALCEGGAFEDADAILREMIALCPQHSYLDGQLMDRTLPALRARLAPQIFNQLRRA
jgi:class 3 adenylate cyclase